MASPSGAAQGGWVDKYVAQRVDGDKGSLIVLDFATSREVPPEDWAAAQAAEAREQAARPAALAAAARAAYAHPAVPRAQLNDGHSIPLVGLGTWKADKGQVRAAVHQALQAGYRHIDCAAVYNNEEEVGEALAAALEGGHVQREELFICSKVWNNDHSADRVRAACLRSLKALRLSYLDLYMIHWPVTGNVGQSVTPPIQETWRAMEGLVREGLVRSIGVSNFSAKKLGEILAYAGIPPAVCQVEIHPYHRNDSLINWCKERGIHVTAYSPLGSPDSESIFPRKRPLRLLEDPTLKRIAQRTGKDVGQVLIRWAIQHGTSVIPKSTSPSRIRGNLQVLDWELSEADYAALSTLRNQQRMVNGALWLNPKGPYRTMDDLWDEPEAEDVEDISEAQPQAGLLTKAGPPASTTDQGEEQGQGSLPREQTVVLNNGARMPLLGIGTWKSEKGLVRASVELALKLGCRHIDCAEYYANEHEVGEALEALFSSGTVRREEVWVTSKVWNSNHAAKDVERSLKRTLANLRLDYLDLYLIHWPVTGNKGPSVLPPIQETWRAMEGLVREGLVRSIGVSNFSAKKLGEILAYAGIPPAVCQVEVHPYHRNDSLICWCKERGIHVTAYSPLGSPDSATLLQRDTPVLLKDPTLAEIAGRLNKSPAQVLIRWALQHGTSVLAKSTSPQRIQENAQVWGWELSEADYSALCQLGGGRQWRMVDGSFFLNPGGPYRTLAQLWDE